jgi:hypothetical protein
MSEIGDLDQLPADVPPPLRAAVAAALAWLRELDREAGAGVDGSPPRDRTR